MTNLNELLDLAPIMLSPDGIIDGQTIHSNSRIKDYVKEWVKFSPATKDISKKVIEGIEAKKIMIGYEHTSKLRFLKTRYRDYWEQDRSSENGYLGYISVSDHKVAIILDENVNITGKSIRDISPTITHELCHLIALDLWKPYLLACMKPYLIPFYQNLFVQYEPSVANISNGILTESIIDISRITDHNFFDRPDMAKVFEIWYNYLRHSMSADRADQVLIEVFAPYYKFGIGNLKADKLKLVKPSIFKFAKAYKQLKINDALNITLPSQEIIFPSEIVCIINQRKPSSEIIKLINNLQF